MNVRCLSVFFKAMLLALELINLEILFTSYKQKRLKVRYLRLFALCVKYKFQFKGLLVLEQKDYHFPIQKDCHFFGKMDP